MVSGVNNFVGNRLTQARKARGLMAVSLADMVGVSQTTISLYEKGVQKPKQETVELLSNILNVPNGFFLSESEANLPEKLFYRSMSSVTKSMRDRVEARHEWVLDVIKYLNVYFDFPELNLPSFSIPENFTEITDKIIEETANELRQYWLLGDSPIADMTQLLETNGIIVYRGEMGSEKLDAFSDPRMPNPIIALSSDKNNYYRSRFDAAHELGHLILHNNVDKKSLAKGVDFKIIERQADYFASVFLLPSIPYSNDLWSPTLEAFRSLKPIWKVSIGMQIKRAKSLGFISDAEEKRLWINRTRRGWSKSEPLDSSTPVEIPNLIYKSFKVLLDEGLKSCEQIVSDINIHAHDLESLFDFPQGFLTVKPSSASPMLKSNGGTNIVDFKR